MSNTMLVLKTAFDEDVRLNADRIDLLVNLPRLLLMANLLMCRIVLRSWTKL